jgi:RimJ/RimL family protein N-acetyltransferase
MKEICGIRAARLDEAGVLTDISFASKGYWQYPPEYFEIWKGELIISPEYVGKNDVFVCEVEREIAGYYSVVTLTKDIEVSGIRLERGVWLEHMFLLPGYIGKGFGTKMVDHLRKWCRATGTYRLGILADPNSRGFYEKMGCRYVMEYPSTIEGRTTPYLILNTGRK